MLQCIGAGFFPQAIDSPLHCAKCSAMGLLSQWKSYIKQYVSIKILIERFGILWESMCWQWSASLKGVGMLPLRKDEIRGLETAELLAKNVNWVYIFFPFQIQTLPFQEAFPIGKWGGWVTKPSNCISCPRETGKEIPMEIKSFIRTGGKGAAAVGNLWEASLWRMTWGWENRAYFKRQFHFLHQYLSIRCYAFAPSFLAWISCGAEADHIIGSEWGI